MNKETYKINCLCENCYHHWIEDILKGQLALGYFTCPFCGCDRGKSQGKCENKQSPAYFYESKFSETPWEMGRKIKKRTNDGRIENRHL